jgi:hypothetical protein
MKMSAPGHPKTKELRLVLGCSLPQAIGHLELLWHFCAQHSPAGDIGKWTDAAIADAAGWPDDPVKFTDALVKTGWLERHSDHRLTVHDWREHAPAWVSAKLKKLGIQWVTSEKGQAPLLDGGPSPTTLHSPPSLAKPSQAPLSGRQVGRFLDFWKAYPKKVKRKTTEEVWKLKGLDAMADKLIEDIKVRLDEDDRWKRGFIPDPPTYLRQERWADEITPPQERRR